MQQTCTHKAVTRRVEAKKDSKSYSLVEGNQSIEVNEREHVRGGPLELREGVSGSSMDSQKAP